MDKWINVTFESSSYKTPQFTSFARAFRSYIKKTLPRGYELVKYSIGHFYVSGFIKSPEGKYTYFSTSDVRHFPSEWFDHVLIRTAKSDTDYTGGANCYTSLDDLANKAIQLSIN